MHHRLLPVKLKHWRHAPTVYRDLRSLGASEKLVAMVAPYGCSRWWRRSQYSNLLKPFLGVHFTIKVDGTVKIGPTAIPAFWRENRQRSFQILAIGTSGNSCLGSLPVFIERLRVSGSGPSRDPEIPKTPHGRTFKRACQTHRPFRV